MNALPTITRVPLCLLGLFSLTLFVSPVAAQVFDAGPSDSALFDTVINIPTDPDFGDSVSIGGDGSTTQLNITDGGSIGDLFEADSGSELNISGGIVGFEFNANSDSEVNISGGFIQRFSAANDGSVVNLSGGLIDFGFNANSGSEVNISGGNIVMFFVARSGSVVNISGGNAGLFFDAESGSEVNISGGFIGNGFDAESNSDVNISGGSFGRGFRALIDSDVELIGGDFQLNGEAFTGSTISFGVGLTDNADMSIPTATAALLRNNGDVFTGTLADGSAFIFSEADFDDFSEVQLTLAPLPAVDLSPIVVSTPNPNLSSSLRAGQELTLLDGGELNGLTAVGATLNVEGGILGNGAEVAGSTVNISGGEVGAVFDAEAGSQINISGGVVGSAFNAESGSEVNISGGTFGSNFDAFADSVINLFGSNFVLDGVPLDGGLTTNSAFTVLDRDVILSGLLADGSPFSFDLTSFNVDTEGYFDPDATLTVTLVPSDPNFILCDVNQDGVLDFADIPAFIGVLQAGTFLQEADCNEDGVVDFADIPAFIAALIAS